MADYISSIILLIIALGAIELRKTYHQVPRNELRYLARHGDQLAKRIYQAVSYEESLEILLWAVVILCFSLSLIILNSIAPFWLDFIAIVFFLSITFAWLPKTKVNSFSWKLVHYLTPAILFVLNIIYPVLRKIHHDKKRDSEAHTGIYSKRELISLINKQKRQPDNRINHIELDLVKNILKLKDKTVGQYAKNWSKIKTVLANDTIGPILLDELHKSKQLFIPVVNENEDQEVVGMINLSTIDISSARHISDLMDTNIEYLNEDDNLEDALKKISLTGYQVFIVLDKKQRVFGLITFNNIVNELFTSGTIEKNTKLDLANISNDNTLTQADNITDDSLKTT